MNNSRLVRLLLRIARSNSFYPISSVIQFVLDSAILAITAIVASYARFVYQGHFDPMGATSIRRDNRRNRKNCGVQYKLDN